MAEPLEDLLTGIRAAADPSRLRLLAVCSQGEWTVSELVQVLGQSQPRISRHLKILAEAGLLDRFREGGWVFYRRAQAGEGARIARTLCRLLPDADPALAMDRRRLEAVREARRRAAERYFDDRASGWDSERGLGPSTASMVEAALRRLFEAERPANLLDVGTGTGRMLQLLARHVGFGLGVDISHDMLAVARANLDRREARNCQVRHGDMYQLPLPDASFEAVTLHQVLHFADDPARVLAEAARVLRSGRPAGRRRSGGARRRAAAAGAGASAARLRGRRDGGAGWRSAAVPGAARAAAGAELTVVIWSARRPAAAGDESDNAERREAAMTVAYREAVAAAWSGSRRCHRSSSRSRSSRPARPRRRRACGATSSCSPAPRRALSRSLAAPAARRARARSTLSARCRRVSARPWQPTSPAPARRAPRSTRSRGATGRRRAPDRGPAGRPAQGRRTYRPARGRLRLRERPRGRASRPSPTSTSASPATPRCIPRPDASTDLENLKRKIDGRGDPPHHPVLLRHRPDPPLPRRARGRGHRGRVRARHHADP